MSYHDIVKELIKKRAKAETGIYETRQKEIATERATKEKYRRQNKEAEIGEEMFEDGTYEPLGERISTSKARDTLREMGEALVREVMQDKPEDAITIAKEMKKFAIEARLTPKLKEQVKHFKADLTKLMASTKSWKFTQSQRNTLRGYLSDIAKKATVEVPSPFATELKVGRARDHEELMEQEQRDKVQEEKARIEAEEKQHKKVYAFIKKRQKRERREREEEGALTRAVARTHDTRMAKELKKQDKARKRAVFTRLFDVAETNKAVKEMLRPVKRKIEFSIDEDDEGVPYDDDTTRSELVGATVSTPQNPLLLDLSPINPRVTPGRMSRSKAKRLEGQPSYAQQLARFFYGT